MLAMHKLSVAAAGLAVCLSINMSVALAQDHSHSHDGSGSTQLTLNHGKKWATDENLRLSMIRIRDALEAELPAIHSGKASAKQYQALAKKVNDQISFMVQNCKLDRDADAMLHLVLAELIDGSDAMVHQGSGEAMHQGVEKIAHALENYGTYFDHPGWRGVK